MVSADICASFRVSMENRSIFGNAPVFVHNETPPMIRHDSQSKSDMEKGRDQNRDASETASLLSFRACLNYTIGALLRFIDAFQRSSHEADSGMARPQRLLHDSEHLRPSGIQLQDFLG